MNPTDSWMDTRGAYADGFVDGFADGAYVMAIIDTLVWYGMVWYGVIIGVEREKDSRCFQNHS